jgi:monothiol glutaredoxin
VRELPMQASGGDGLDGLLVTPIDMAQPGRQQTPVKRRRTHPGSILSSSPRLRHKTPLEHYSASDVLPSNQANRRNIMTRSILDEAHIHPSIREVIASGNADIVREVQGAMTANDVVVVGMAQNPFPKKARKLLEGAGIAHKYLEYGSYFTGWRRRNALKMWSGWPTFPMVFVKGVLVGGANDLERLLKSGELMQMLGGKPGAAAA